MSGKRKKDDSEAVGIMKFLKSTERNMLSSKEPSDIAERSPISRGACPRNPPLNSVPKAKARKRHARVGFWPKYLPIIARFPPVKNLSYILYIPVIYM